jgi:translin
MIEKLEAIAEEIHASFEARNRTRDQALTDSRTLIRHCAKAIRAAHREEWSLSQEHLAEAIGLADLLRANKGPDPDIYFAGYTQDALKEFAEANMVYAMLRGEQLPSPSDLNLEYNTFLRGLAETAGEMRRRCLDLLRQEKSAEAEFLLARMDDIYGVLVTMDYPDAITAGLRRLTDMVRGVTERTRADLTLTLIQGKLERRIRGLEGQLDAGEGTSAGALKTP